MIKNIIEYNFHMKLKVILPLIPLTLIITLSGCGTEITRLENLERLKSNKTYKNLFPSHYVGQGPHHKMTN
jgi:N-acyl-phosphatidylethanolamine-hydrolysing phospholipase D